MIKAINRAMERVADYASQGFVQYMVVMIPISLLGGAFAAGLSALVYVLT